MSDFSTLEVIRDPRGFATLWLSREDKNNAFNAQMIRELIVAIDRLAEDANLRFV
ncbi:gamma-carboxygeranoyl-CoA hydratase, partial [Pseudomonas syringae]